MTDTRAAFEAYFLKRWPPGLASRGAREGAWDAWQAAINHERSECAKVCDDRAIDPYAEVDQESRACAAAIRARSQP